MMFRSVVIGMVLVAPVSLMSGCDANPNAASRHDAGVPPKAASGAAPSASASTSSCPRARIEFGLIRKGEVLTEVADEVTITSPTGGRLDAPLHPVRQYTAQVAASEDVPREQVYAAFLHKVDPDAQRPELGEVATGGTSSTTIQGPGRFVRYEGVFAREATFRYGCGAVSVSGTVSSWLIPVSGVLSCDGKPEAHKKMAAEAAALGWAAHTDPAVEGLGSDSSRSCAQSSRTIGMHLLRHTYASVLLDADESVTALSLQLGHADPGCTLRVYTHLLPSSEDRARRAIDWAFNYEPSTADGPETARP